METSFCWALMRLKRVIEERGGVKPSYTLFHAIKLLEEVRREPRGRPYLARALKLGEASTKTLIKRMREEGLVFATNRGHAISDDGRRVLDAVASSIAVFKVPLSRDLGLQSPIALVARIPAPSSVTDALKLRDIVVKSGCEGGLVGAMHSIPGVPDEIERGILTALKSLISDRRMPGETVIIVDEDCVATAFSALLLYMDSLYCG